MIVHGMGDTTDLLAAGGSVSGSAGFSSGGDSSAGTPETQGSGPPNITSSPVMQSGITRAISSAHRGITGMLGGSVPVVSGATRAMTSLSQARMTGSLTSTGYKGTSIQATAQRMGYTPPAAPSPFPLKKILLGFGAGAAAIFVYKKWVR